MNWFNTTILSAAVMLTLTACGNASNTEPEHIGNFEAAGEITVSAYDTMACKAFLEDAAALFEAKNPGTKVYIETFSAMPEIKTSGDGNLIMAEYQDDTQSKQDYINTVNTALMSGSGADVLAMDVLPFHKYADALQLENLAEYMQSDHEFDKSDYRSNIIDAVEYKDGIWFLPLDYTFNFFAFDSAVYANAAFGIGEKFTAEELIELAKPHFDGSVTIFDRPNYSSGPRPDMWSLILAENYTTFLDIENKTANFNDGRFEYLIESLKQHGEDGYIATGHTDLDHNPSISDERFFFKPKNALSLIAFYTRGLEMPLNALGEGNTMSIGAEDNIAGIESAANGSVPFTFSQAYGINSSSKNKGTAWAFIKFLLSDEMQQDMNLAALPVLNSAREQKMEQMLTSLAGEQALSQSEVLHKASADYNVAAEKLSGMINSYIIRDAVIEDMIAAEARHFFEGTKSSAEAADILQSKINLYLNE